MCKELLGKEISRLFGFKDLTSDSLLSVCRINIYLLSFGIRPVLCRG